MFLLVLASGLGAQTTATSPASPAGSPSSGAIVGSIAGTVTGKEGEAYEGVQVTLAIGGESTARTAETDPNGNFVFANLPVGPFTLTASSQGFETQALSGELHAGESYDTPTIVLPLKETTSEVRVSAEQQVEIAEEQIHIEEKQRVLGILPNYYVSYAKNPMPLTTRQKFELAFRSDVDPFTFLLTGIFAGIQQADNSLSGYGQGMQGYGKRFGANYADTVVSNEIGGAILPSLFHQDPRYFYKGTGSIRARTGYAIAAAVICKGDNMRWQFSYASILGGLAASGISNLYYPKSDRSGAALTFENLGVGLAGSALQNIFQEFIVKKFTPSARRAGLQ